MKWLTQGLSGGPRDHPQVSGSSDSGRLLFLQSQFSTATGHTSTPAKETDTQGTALAAGLSQQSQRERSVLTEWHVTTCVKSLQPRGSPEPSVQGLHRGQTQRHVVPPAMPGAHWEREPKPPARRTASTTAHVRGIAAVAQRLGYIKTLSAGRTVQDTHRPSRERVMAGLEDLGMCGVCCQ